MSEPKDKIPVLTEITEVERQGTTSKAKVIWPDPKTINFTTERRDPFSTLSVEEFDRRKKK